MRERAYSVARGGRLAAPAVCHLQLCIFWCGPGCGTALAARLSDGLWWAAWRLYSTTTGTCSLWPAVSLLAAPARAQGPGPGGGQRGGAGRAQPGALGPGGQ